MLKPKLCEVAGFAPWFRYHELGFAECDSGFLRSQFAT